MTETDPGTPNQDKQYTCGLRTYYEDLRQLLGGVQVSGPRLTPASIDKGFHAIPAHRSSDPNVPSCYYEPGDYTCVKDAATGWWDARATNASNLAGCFRMLDRGLRYPAGSWPKRDGLAVMRDGEPCNAFQGGVGGIDTPAGTV